MRIQLDKVMPQLPSDQRQMLRQPVTLNIESCDWVKVDGENGSGKSTLLRILVGLHRNYLGDYAINGLSARNLSAAEVRKSGLAYLPQHSFIFPSLTVGEFRKLIAGRQLSQPAGGRLMRFLSQISPRTQFRHLAGGVQQLLGLLSIMARPAELYALDEPFRHLDDSVRQEMKGFFRDLRRSGTCALVIVDHSDSLDESGSRAFWNSKLLLEGSTDGDA